MEIAGFAKLIIQTGLEIILAFYTMWSHAILNRLIRALGFPKMFEVSALTAFVITTTILSLPIIGGYISILGMITNNFGNFISSIYGIFEYVLSIDLRILLGVVSIVVLYYVKSLFS